MSEQPFCTYLDEPCPYHPDRCDDGDCLEGELAMWAELEARELTGFYDEPEDSDDA